MGTMRLIALSYLNETKKRKVGFFFTEQGACVNEGRGIADSCLEGRQGLTRRID